MVAMTSYSGTFKILSYFRDILMLTGHFGKIYFTSPDSLARKIISQKVTFNSKHVNVFSVFSFWQNILVPYKGWSNNSNGFHNPYTVMIWVAGWVRAGTLVRIVWRQNAST